MLNPISRLQRWYISQCNDEWEHAWGIKIGTLDNPGWTIDINLEDTARADKPCKPIYEDISDDDWIHMDKRENDEAEKVLRVRCGPTCLERAIATACDWLEGKLDEV